MPFVRTKLDYIVTLLLLISFLYAFFYGSIWGDIRGQSNPDDASASYVNLWVIVGPLVLVYEMFQLFVLPGKRRGRELPWRLYFQMTADVIKKKASSSFQEYKLWRRKD